MEGNGEGGIKGERKKGLAVTPRKEKQSIVRAWGNFCPPRLTSGAGKKRSQPRSRIRGQHSFAVSCCVSLCKFARESDDSCSIEDRVSKQASWFMLHVKKKTDNGKKKGTNAKRLNLCHESLQTSP